MPTNNSRITEATIPPPYGACYIGGMLVSGEDIFSSRYHNITTPTAINAPFPLHLGATVITADNRVYRYVKAQAGVAVGEVVKPYATDAKDYSAETAVAYDASQLKVSFPNVAAATAGSLIGMLLVKHTAAGAGGPLETRIITQNTGTDVFIDRPLGAAPAAAADYHVVSPWYVDLAGATAHTVVGVASVGALTAGQYGWVQSKGVCEGAASAAVTWAMANYVMPAAAGRVTNTGAVAGEPITIGYYIGGAAGGASTGGDLVPIYLHGE